MTLKAILFDVDGTLVDTNDLHTRAWVETLAAHGVDVPYAAVRAEIGKGGDQLLPDLLPRNRLGEATAIEQARSRLYAAAYLPQAKPFPGVRDLFARIRAGGRSVVLATSGAAAEVEHYLDLLGVRDLVDAVTTADDAARSKPYPDIFAAALRRAHAQPHEAVVVGDSPYDIIAANQLDLPAVALLSGGFAEDRLRACGAVAVYPDIAALLAGYDASPLAG